MKSLDKGHILESGQYEATKLEKEIMEQAEHPFLVGLNFIFQTDNKVCFVMRFVQGGELFAHLHRVQRFTETAARFYCAQMVLALGHLHSQGILYRDLKPENILISAENGESGFLRLTDFGLAKKI